MKNLRKSQQLVRHLDFFALWLRLEARFGPGGRQSAILMKFSEILSFLLNFTKFGKKGAPG